MTRFPHFFRLLPLLAGLVGASSGCQESADCERSQAEAVEVVIKVTNDTTGVDTTPLYIPIYPPFTQQWIRFVHAPAPVDSPDVVHFKAVGLDTLQYALELLERWSRAFDTREYAGRLKAKTDSLLNDPVIRERRMLR